MKPGLDRYGGWSSYVSLQKLVDIHANVFGNLPEK